MHGVPPAGSPGRLRPFKEYKAEEIILNVIMTFFCGLSPRTLVASPVTIVPYHLYALAGKFPLQGIPGNRNAP